MPQSFSHGIEALHFIQALKRLGSPSAVIPSMHQAVARHGFENLVFYQPFEDVVLGKHLSEEWTRIYTDYMHYDPIVRHLRRAVRPFEWREITFDGQRYPRAAELVRLRADFGFRFHRAHSRGCPAPVQWSRCPARGLNSRGETNRDYT